MFELEPPQLTIKSAIVINQDFLCLRFQVDTDSFRRILAFRVWAFHASTLIIYAILGDSKQIIIMETDWHIVLIHETY